MGSGLELRAVDGRHFSVYRRDPVLLPKAQSLFCKKSLVSPTAFAA
jgi:hypothetical protein